MLSVERTFPLGPIGTRLVQSSVTQGQESQTSSDLLFLSTFCKVTPEIQLGDTRGEDKIILLEGESARGLVEPAFASGQAQDQEAEEGD